jgi:aminopeptidase
MTDAVRDSVDRLADLAVRVGANVAPGQHVFVLAHDLDQAPLARAVAESAYGRGAHLVSVLYWDPHIKLSRLRHAPAETLDLVPDWFDRHIEECIERRGAYISLWTDGDPSGFAEIEAERIARDQTPVTSSFVKAMASGLVNRTAIPGPTTSWAERLFGEADDARLWEMLTSVLRLDTGDPAAAWRAQGERLARRAASLNKRGFDAIHFDGPGTNLTIGLIRGGRWVSAAIRTKSGIDTVANIPTEEVFTTPDHRRVDGSVRLTRPVCLLAGGVAENVELTFKTGHITQVNAAHGIATLRALLRTDIGAARLGEIALVDGSSLVGKTGTVFRNVLLDENATSHIAWGRAYDFTVPHLPQRPEERDALGFNLSSIHQDVMIGDATVAVDGITHSGERVPLLRNDVWLLE